MDSHGSAWAMQSSGRWKNAASRSRTGISASSRHSRGVAAELSVPHIQELIQDGEKVVIDGIRSPEEVSIFREHFGDDMLLKCVHAPEKDR
ncbi:MAG: hypothetical protein SVU32_03980, partial [Candidatus Nanohaloarchaea archaeon]|nr:hypothetical protein [Candidatus Nanohaloarchaea archaeon]